MEHPATLRKKLLSWIFWLKQKLLVNSANYLEVTGEGKFYLAVTIALGVGALISGNNILYLLDAILLSALTISGIVSDRIITGIEIDVYPKQAIALQPSEDRIKLTNRRKYRLFFIKVFEVSDEGTQCIGEIPEIEAQSSVWISSRGTFQSRGKHTISHYSVGTYYPFGLALKKLPHTLSSIRIVWPSRSKSVPLKDELRDSQMHQRWGSQITEGEVREYQTGEDSRNIVWTISSKFEDEFYIRPRRAAREKLQLVLDRRTDDARQFESKVSELATTLYDSFSSETEITLKILASSGPTQIHDRAQAIEVLAKVQMEKSEP